MSTYGILQYILLYFCSFLLAISAIKNQQKVPTMVFDEILGKLLYKNDYLWLLILYLLGFFGLAVSAIKNQAPITRLCTYSTENCIFKVTQVM